MNEPIPQFLIAAPHSGCGKTTVCRGLMAALCRRGMTVQPYKCGPDYIDTKFHAAVCGRPSVNLDTFMASASHVYQLYHYYAKSAFGGEADACIIEGMMGLFDGYEREKGSSYEIARLLGIPIILVVDARSASYSLAALLSGFLHFRPDVRIAGVLFNQVGSVRHYELLLDVCEDVGVPCFGYLPNDKALEQNSRYLGLDFSQERGKEWLDYLVAQTEKFINISSLLQAVRQPLSSAESPFPPGHPASLNIAVAHDADTFTFIYTEHLDILSHLGSVTFFSPADNQPVPPETDLLYLPGGYPEKHTEQLAAATNSMRSIREYIEAGGKALAECGGMIYLSRGIYFDTTPTFLPLANVLPFSISCRAEDKKLSLGYRQFTYRGMALRGHEFHYTQFYTADATPIPSSVAQVYNARHQPVATPVFRYKNLVASYTHLYWGEIDIIQLFNE